MGLIARIPWPGPRRLAARLWTETVRRSEIVAWRASAAYRANRRAIERFRDRHEGERCVIVGNGPSLLSTDLSRLAGEVCFGMNRIYLVFDRSSFRPTYFVCVNNLVLEQFWHEIGPLPLPKFVSWHARSHLTRADDVLLIRDPLRGELGFTRRPWDLTWFDSTVTYAALQLAYFMGFRTAILIGVDHSFSTPGPAHQEVESASDDANHFHPAYFGKGIRWNLPDLEGSEQAYRLAARTWQSDGRAIVDATVGGKLAVFPKVDFDQVFPP